MLTDPLCIIWVHWTAHSIRRPNDNPAHVSRRILPFVFFHFPTGSAVDLLCPPASPCSHQVGMVLWLFLAIPPYVVLHWIRLLLQGSFTKFQLYSYWTWVRFLPDVQTSHDYCNNTAATIPQPHFISTTMDCHDPLSSMTQIVDPMYGDSANVYCLPVACGA